MENYATMCGHWNAQIPAHTDHECQVVGDEQAKHEAAHAAAAKAAAPAKKKRFWKN